MVAPTRNAAPHTPRTPHVEEGTAVARRRPVGVTLIAALLLLNLVGALVGLLGTLFGGVPVGGVMLVYFAIMTVVLGAVLYGFWTFQPWGWMGTLALTILGVALSLYQLLTFTAMGIAAGTLIGLAVGLVVIWYLTRPAVRALFAPKSRI
ncbi:hypothetical protein ACM64Y_17705 [Novispirillum sp. DQ9]|uniref:hypothetical protein n=1 Tax=Novispirillum sp. DQ9 TaxID=3398612 RepID=UPI003C7A08BC